MKMTSKDDLLQDLMFEKDVPVSVNVNANQLFLHCGRWSPTLYDVSEWRGGPVPARHQYF